MKIKKDITLQKYLDQYRASALSIKDHILKKGMKRFSYKKMVADIGEYYFLFYCTSLFSSLEQSEKATADYDFLGEFKDTSLKKFYPNKVKIEVKSRHAQLNAPYLLGIKVEKFDILVFVHLEEDYSCRYIGIIDKKDLNGRITSEDKRLVYRKEIPTLWQTNEFIELKK